MAALQPTFYKLNLPATHSAILTPELHKILYNLQTALYALMNNLDDVGIAGTEYRTKIGTDLSTAHANLLAPPQGYTV